MNQNHFDIDEIKSRIKIWDVIHHFGHDCPEKCIAIKSPLRGDNNPSFSIFANGEAAKDHSTGEGFDVISLYRAFASCNLHDAIKGCGSIAGLSAAEIPDAISVPMPPKSKLAKPHPEDPVGARHRKASLREELGELTDEVREQMKLFAHVQMTTGEGILPDFCKHKNIEPDFMTVLIDRGVVGVLAHPRLKHPVIAWLFYNSFFGHGCKLRFQHDSSRMTMWWVGSSQQHFFGEQLIERMQPHFANEQDDSIIVTEGESDALIMLQHGIPALGVVGASVLPDHRIVNYFLAYRKVGVWYDPDKAGKEATKNIQDHILAHASGAVVVNAVGSKLPDGLDIGDCWVKYQKRFSDYALKEFDRIKSIK